MVSLPQGSMDTPEPTSSNSNRTDVDDDTEIGLGTETIDRPQKGKQEAKAGGSSLNPLSPVPLTP